jgi:hypothetical protein
METSCPFPLLCSCTVWRPPVHIWCNCPVYGCSAAVMYGDLLSCSCLLQL